MKVRNDLDILRDEIFEIADSWEVEMRYAAVPTPTEDIAELIMEKVKLLLAKQVNK